MERKKGRDLNPLAKELNEVLEGENPALYSALSSLGKDLYFPRGILAQTAEVRQGAHRYNATIGIARSKGEAMYLPAVMDLLGKLPPDEALDYAPATGNVQLRHRWLSDMLKKNPSLAGKKLSLPIVTSGITHGLSIVGDLFLDEGDALIIPDKYWENYNLVFGVRRGANILTFPFFDEGGGFNIPAMASEVGKALDEKGKAVLVLNFPNNPTGYSLLKSEAKKVSEALIEASRLGGALIVMFDDAYFGLTYDEGVFGESLFGLVAGAEENLISIKLDGATKEKYAWGFRVGFITFGLSCKGEEEKAYSALEKKVAGAIRGSISNCSQLSQSVLLRAMENPKILSQERERQRELAERALKTREALSNPDYKKVWDVYPFNSGYFMCLRLKGIDGEEFRKSLIADYGVGVITDGNDVRIAFSCLEVEEIPSFIDILYRCAVEHQEKCSMTPPA
ncbi:MAG: aminotransferase class I/II-fold pyridoxal phosphate-dependent enzyme [Actinomycetota bacterium]|nr:aminotransferase class I/II-fold pyridoxal phosphate-dependent enzyme [Actinomycetota bacterium]